MWRRSKWDISGNLNLQTFYLALAYWAGDLLLWFFKFWTNTGGRQGWIKTATRVFQGLRIAVNDELKTLENSLHASFDCLAPGGRLAVISFHSLEDRIVKQTFLGIINSQSKDEVPFEEGEGGRYFKKTTSGSNENEKWIKQTIQGLNGTILTKRPITPSEEEEKLNSRSRSAKLRVIQKVWGHLLKLSRLKRKYRDLSWKRTEEEGISESRRMTTNWRAILIRRPLNDKKKKDWTVGLEIAKLRTSWKSWWQKHYLYSCSPHWYQEPTRRCLHKAGPSNWLITTGSP